MSDISWYLTITPNLIFKGYQIYKIKTQNTQLNYNFRQTTNNFFYYKYIPNTAWDTLILKV